MGLGVSKQDGALGVRAPQQARLRHYSASTPQLYHASGSEIIQSSIVETSRHGAWEAGRSEDSNRTTTSSTGVKRSEAGDVWHPYGNQRTGDDGQFQIGSVDSQQSSPREASTLSISQQAVSLHLGPGMGRGDVIFVGKQPTPTAPEAVTRAARVKADVSASPSRPAQAKFDDHSSEQSVNTASPAPGAARIHEGAQAGVLRSLSSRSTGAKVHNSGSEILALRPMSVKTAQFQDRVQDRVSHTSAMESVKSPSRTNYNGNRELDKDRGDRRQRLARRSASDILESSAAAALSEILAESKRGWESKLNTKPKSSSAESIGTVAAAIPLNDRTQTREQNTGQGNRASGRQATQGILRCRPPQWEPAVESLNSQPKGGYDHGGNGNQKMGQGNQGGRVWVTEATSGQTRSDLNIATLSVHDDDIYNDHGNEQALLEGNSGQDVEGFRH